MFSWICPTCGHEVPPSYDACPLCADKPQKKEEAPAAPAPPAAPVRRTKRRRSGLPGWLVAVLVCAVLCGGALAAYYFLLPSSRVTSDEAQAEPAAERAPAAPATELKGYEKVIEISGLRIFEDQKKPKLRFMVVNHASTELAALEGTVNVLSKDNAPITSVPLKLDTLAAYEAKDVTAPLNTKLRAYELPDWQFLRGEFKLK